MMRKWILVGHTPIEVDVNEWSRWFERADRIIDKTEIRVRGHQYEVSTVFLGIDMVGEGRLPELFETMVFTDDEAWDSYQVRSRSYLEAQRIHKMISIQVAANDKP